MKTTTPILLLALALTGCASVKPRGLCRMSDGKAEVHQGFLGIGLTQEMPDIDRLCAPLTRTAATP